jgi:hypothetical protein
MKIVYFSIVIMIFFISCKSERSENEIVNLDSINVNEVQEVIFKLDTLGDGLPIFYNMYLSVELSSLFETSGTVFELGILNSTDKVTEYISSYKQAMNMGIYAVDLSYSKAFEQSEIAGWYLKAMQQLSQEMGIPNEYFHQTIRRFENNLHNKDSVYKIANEVYSKTDEHLRQNERYTTSVFIILGGWVEAIHIGIRVAVESKDINIIERLAEQKYSLDHLILMLSDYKENEIMAEYIEKLLLIKSEFEDFKVDIDPELIDNPEYYRKETEKYFNCIKKIEKPVYQLRNDIIN